MHHEVYKYWTVLKELPESWKIDTTSGSPLSGHVFVTNGKSPLHGQERALLKMQNRTIAPTEPIAHAISEIVEPRGKIETVIDASCVRAVNELARKKFEERLLKDILVDLMICEIEGWGKREYIAELKRLISGLLPASPDQSSDDTAENQASGAEDD